MAEMLDHILERLDNALSGESPDEAHVAKILEQLDEEVERTVQESREAKRKGG